MKIRTFVFFLITGLAAIGLLSMLVSSPHVLGKRILFLIVVASLLYIVYRIGIRKPVQKDHQAFLRAAKKSKKRIRKRQSSRLSTHKRKPIRRRNDVHLTVIEGKKGKKKKRA
ncbi:MAG: hypothetical protein IMW92_12615 [Bacillales bacterium]|nr:hypothetical protein [Bacillales bacterium]